MKTFIVTTKPGELTIKISADCARTKISGAGHPFLEFVQEHVDSLNVTTEGVVAVFSWPEITGWHEVTP